ncbi:hypothetical protein BOTBODRAFT_58868 [Botryobasidium botryosum FD-172 SS1]|uniref:Uncharacterized protein n=1 Tax=Botryobasidium botryosum (strain FD-172 SS1) TaxID=930990 RepID=A0A067M009_BOTB1|nr:hypothetical protein BOTBODRAFT_58868 [Botryobasidium botryosum FD-172 SS1]
MSQKTSGPNVAEPKLTGLELASSKFRLINPVSAPDDAPAWEIYARKRSAEAARAYNAAEAPEYEDEEDREWGGDDDTRIIYEGVHDTIKALEKECGLEDGVLGECVWVESCSLDGLEGPGFAPRNCETYSRIYSLATPAHVDVHFQYHERTRMESIEWNYSIGYKIHDLAGEDVAFRFTSCGNKTHRGRPDMRSICWAFYDDDEGFRHREWRRVEVFGFDLDQRDVLNIHQALFGPLEPLAADADDAAIAARRCMLVRTVRILLASVGIDYPVRCKEEEDGGEEENPHRNAALDWTLESSSIDQWIARGTRKACGFQLASDPEMERAGVQARKEELEYHSEYDSEDEENSDSSDRGGGRYSYY